jgi:hypothetical protein
MQVDPIITERLELIPLTGTQLDQIGQDFHQLVNSFGLQGDDGFLSPVVKRAIGIKLNKMEKAPLEQHPWFSYWMIVVTDEKTAVGMIGFKGNPDAEGAVEVGYGIAPAFEGYGYMTEALGGLVAWAFSQSDCKAIVAPGTLKTNPGSNRVLQKNGFHIYAEDEKSNSWMLKKTEIVKK